MTDVRARIQGQVVDQLPSDLYIPPEALRVFLEVFEGPLDFLSYLVRKQKLDILNIDVAGVADQYSSYVYNMMQDMHFELAADYLAMAAWLTELKSRFLLPRPKHDADDEQVDPRAELIQRILEYDQIRHGAEALDELDRLERDIFLSSVVIERTQNQEKVLPQISKEELVEALADALHRASLYEHHTIRGEPLSTRERMAKILATIHDMLDQEYIAFTRLLRSEEGGAGIVVTILAILELLRESCIELIQNEPFSDIYLKMA